MSGFRLLSAQTLEHFERRPWRPGYRGRPVPPIAVNLTGPDANRAGRTPSSLSHVSVLLGKNGQGKSRFLSAVATSFQLLQRYRDGSSERGLPLARLEYVAQERHHLIRCEGSKIGIEVDGKTCPVDDIVLPSRVIGLSMTPFDKFPLGNEPRQLDLFSPEMPDIYSYLGMRERMGRSSSSALLSRAMEGMFARVGSDDRGRISHVFDMLGFVPNLAIVYRLETTRMIHALADGDDLDAIMNERRSSFMYQRMQRVARSGEPSLEELREAARQSLAIEENRYVTVELDLREPNLAAFAAHSHLLLLRRAGLGRLYAVEAKRKNGTVIDLKEASSGELSMAITFMSLAANLTDSALVLIDEPETNLHPEWQARYIDLLLRTFKEFGGCHYVLATHSPLILSDAPPNATVASLNDGDLQDGSDVSGRPVDYLLVKAFDVASGANYYVQEELVKALRLAADGEARGDEFQTSVRELADLRPLINDSPGVVALIGDLEKIASKSRLK